MIYKVSLKTVKGHTSVIDVVADSPDHAIDKMLEMIPFDVREVWCEDIHQVL